MIGVKIVGITDKWVWFRDGDTDVILSFNKIYRIIKTNNNIDSLSSLYIYIENTTEVFVYDNKEDREIDFKILCEKFFRSVNG